MRNCHKHITVRLFLLALFISYYGSITFFTHYHVVNGVTIVHSHYFHSDPHKGHQEAGHTHTSAEFTIIAHHSDFTTLTGPTLHLGTPIQYITTNYQAGNAHLTPNIPPLTSYLRGPPISGQ